MTIILTLGVPGTGPYGQINSLRASIRDSEEHLRHMNEGTERKTKKTIKLYEDSIREDRARIKEIQNEQKKQHSAKKL